MTSHPQTQGGDRKNQCESKSRFARLKCSAVPGCLEAIVTRSLNVDHLRVRPRPPEARPDSLRPLNQRAVVALSFMARCPDCGSSSAAVIGNSRTVIATGNEQRCVRAAHMLRFHSNGCDRDDNRQTCRAVQRNLSAVRPLKTCSGSQISLRAARHVDRAAANHQNGDDKDHQCQRFGRRGR